MCCFVLIISHIKLAYCLHPILILQRAPANDSLPEIVFLGWKGSKFFDGTDLFQKLYLYLAKLIK